MSVNQSRAEKNGVQYRKSGVGRSNPSSGQQHRHFSGGTGTGSGAFPAPPLSSISSANSSFKKSNNAQGGQSRGTFGSVNTSSDPNPGSGARSVDNGGQVQSTLHGVSQTRAPASNPKLADTTTQKSNQPIPKAPSSQPSPMTSNSPLPSTPAKGDAGKGFPLQFGSISPGCMNGKVVPPRTSSAPPNLDEQKREQARRDALRAASTVSVPPAPKQQNGASSVQPLTQETHTDTKVKRDVQVTSAPPLMQAHKPSVLPPAGMSTPMSFHQPTVHMQFGGPYPQIQSQGMPTTTFQMPMQMPVQMGNTPQVQQQVFVPGLQNHLMQTRGIIHQGQSLGFNPHLGNPLPHQLGNLGMNMPPQFNQQQAGKFGSARKTVKITHPETHEELRLDNRDGGSPGSKLQLVRPPQSHPGPTYTPTHPIGYYSNPYSAGPPIFPAPNSLPFASTQLTPGSQARRFNYPVSQASPTMSFMNQSTSDSLSNSTVGASRHGTLEPSTSTPIPVTVRASGDSGREKGIDSSSVRKLESRKLLRPESEPGVRKDLEVNVDNSSLQSKPGFEHSKQSGVVPGTSVPTSVDVVMKETVIKSQSTRDMQKHPEKKGDFMPSHMDSGDSSKAAASESAQATMTRPPSGVGHAASVAAHESAISINTASTGAADVDLGIENRESKDEHAKQTDRVLQGVTRQSSLAKEQGEKEVLGGLPSDNSLKATDVVKKIGRDGDDKFDQKARVPEVPQRVVESATSQGEGSQTFTQTSPLMHGSTTSDGTNTSNSTSQTVSQAFMEPGKTKNNKAKKWKEMLQKADAQGTTSDLYLAYKGPEEKKEAVFAIEDTSDVNLKDVSADATPANSPRKKIYEKNKPDLEDWEDAANMSVTGECGGSNNDDKGVTRQKYSRDFLLIFSEQCSDLPEGFEITSDIADALMCSNVDSSRGDREYPSPGRIIDRPSAGARLDRRGNGTMDADRWGKQPGPHPLGRDPGLDLAYGSNVMGFRSGPGANYNVLRNPLGQVPLQHAGGILSGPMHSIGLQRNNPDADRWQRGTNFNKGLMLSPQTHIPSMHKAENKYEVGKVTDEEQVKQRTLKAILNKLTPQNFDKLFEQVKEVNIDNAVTLTGVISQIFDKALMEPTFCEMYANFCYHLASELPDLSVDNEKITFKRLLLNKCQEEFERGEREEEEANKVDVEGETKLSEAEREAKRLKARRSMLGNIRLIGELYKKRMLTERIMHECIKKLLGNPDEENIEALCKLMSTIGQMIDHPKAKEHMDAYYDSMRQLSNNMKLSSRVRFMLKDALDLRKNRWQQRRKVEGPKKIEEVHRDAAQERQGQAGRIGRGPSMSSSMRRGQPLEYAPRGCMSSSQVPQVGGFRGVPTQARGYGRQDLRMDDRSVFENRTLSVPLPQRSSDDEPITLGPQGGLARGMSFRGQPSVSGTPSAETSSSYGDHRRMVGGLNGYSITSDRGAYNSREDRFGRHASERFGSSSAYDQLHSQQLNSNYIDRIPENPDGSMDGSMPTLPPLSQAGVSPAQNLSSEEVWPEERLRDMSIAAIREYYSAKDEKEVALCIKDLNAPSFYPTVISIWVTDAFERKDKERDMLAKLLISLARPQEGIFSQDQLTEGFESVLTNLEDTVTDAPKAPKFLGQIFGKVISENVLPLKDVGLLIHKGGEEPGRLLEAGLAGDILGSVLEMIRLEKGESAFNEIRTSSGLRLEDFRRRILSDPRS